MATCHGLLVLAARGWTLPGCWTAIDAGAGTLLDANRAAQVRTVIDAGAWTPGLQSWTAAQNANPHVPVPFPARLSGCASHRRRPRRGFLGPKLARRFALRSPITRALTTKAHARACGSGTGGTGGTLRRTSKRSPSVRAARAARQAAPARRHADRRLQGPAPVTSVLGMCPERIYQGAAGAHADGFDENTTAQAARGPPVLVRP